VPIYGEGPAFPPFAYLQSDLAMFVQIAVNGPILFSSESPWPVCFCVPYNANNNNGSSSRSRSLAKQTCESRC
jgi:hypothetical protein